MYKYLLLLAALGLAQAQLTPDCETFENGCPVDFDINLLLPHETSCRYYYSCVRGQKVLRVCGTNTIFNEEKQTCDHPVNVDRDCTNDESPERLPGDDPGDPGTIEFLDNGCPVDGIINWHLPHDYYCNHYYQCNWGNVIVRLCPPGLVFNASSQACDFPSNVNCNLPGGIYNPTTRPPIQTTRRPEIDFEDNGCPTDQTINWLVPHEDCTKFYHCVWGGLVEANCPADLHFNPEKQYCDNPAIAGCANYRPCLPDRECSSESKPDDLPGNDAPGDDRPGDDPPGDDPPGDDPPTEIPSEKCVDECQVLPWGHEDCDKFWICVGNKAVLGVCSNGLYFNPSTNTCDFACNVDCDRARVRITPDNDGLTMFVPWKKFDDKAKQLLKAIGH